MGRTEKGSDFATPQYLFLQMRRSSSMFLRSHCMVRRIQVLTFILPFLFGLSASFRLSTTIKMGSSASKKQEYDETMWAHGGPSAPDPTVTFSEKIVEINGHARNVAKWVPAASKKPKGLVVIAHGLHEHCLRYHGLAHALVQKGYAVHAVDHCAHGLSAGGDTKGLVEDYRVMVNDFVSFSRNAQEEVR